MVGILELDWEFKTEIINTLRRQRGVLYIDKRVNSSKNI